MPKADRNAYDPHSACRWYRQREALERRREEINEAEANARAATARAGLLEDKLHEKRGALVPVSALKVFLERMMLPLREGLLSLPSRNAPRVAAATTPAEVRELLEENVRELLENLSRTKLELGDLRSIGPEDPPPPPLEVKRSGVRRRAAKGGEGR
jgi:phage terminase Nu1 subunit (DNA packaging protein)